MRFKTISTKESVAEARFIIQDTNVNNLTILKIKMRSIPVNEEHKKAMYKAFFEQKDLSPKKL